MKIALGTLLAAIAVGPTLVGPAAAGEATLVERTPRAVVELFTSQGCANCPPADAFLSELSRDPGLVTLSFPVDYWDYLGWKDTLAVHAFTLRQRAYSELRGDRNVYTPQVIVNGVTHAVGSNASDVAAAIARDGALSVPVSIVRTGAGWKVEVAGGGARAKVLLVPITRKVSVAIGRGENDGTTIVYSNVARDMRPLADYDGVALSLPLDSAAVQAPRADGFVVILQELSDGKPAAILGAALQRT